MDDGQAIWLANGEDSDRVVAIAHDDEGFSVIEQCDGYFGVRMGRDELIEALREAIAWVSARSPSAS